MALSFARDIRPLFRDTDVDTMQNYGLDLSSYAEVKNKVQAIYATLAEGTMPCDGAWPKDRVATLKRWMDEGMAASMFLPPVLDALSYATGTPLLLSECELTLKDEAESATRKAIFVGHRRFTSQVRVGAEEIQEVEEILANGDELRLSLCWHRYALDRKLALEQFVFHWLAFEALAGDVDVVTRCPHCQAEVQHCQRPVTHRGSNKVAAREIFLATNPEVSVADFNAKIWGKARNSVFHGRHYPEPKYLVELNDLSALIHNATDKHIATELAIEERERRHQGYETLYRQFFFVEWETRDSAVRFADDWPAGHLAQMTAEPAPGPAYHAAEEAGIRLLNYQRESPDW